MNNKNTEYKICLNKSHKVRNFIKLINSIKWNTYIYKMKPSLSYLSSYFWKYYYSNTANWFNQLPSCYYIGAGNPCSEIIFIGKELAFDTTNLVLFFHEMFTNYPKWRKIVYDFKHSKSKFLITKIDNYIKNFEKRYTYCPLNPLTSDVIKKYLPKNTGGHYWRKCEYIVEQYYKVKKNIDINEKGNKVESINDFPRLADPSLDTVLLPS